jgi:hypothetical protein
MKISLASKFQIKSNQKKLANQLILLRKLVVNTKLIKQKVCSTHVVFQGMKITFPTATETFLVVKLR